MPEKTYVAAMLTIAYAQSNQNMSVKDVLDTFDDLQIGLSYREFPRPPVSRKRDVQRSGSAS